MNKYYVYGVSKTNSFAVVVMILAAMKRISSSCVHDCQCSRAHTYRHACVCPLPPFLGWSGTEISITEATTGLMYHPQVMIDDDECGAIGGMLGRGN
jgi:hypothetical protein